MIYKFLGCSYEESFFTHEKEYSQEEFDGFIATIGNEYVKKTISEFEPNDRYKNVFGDAVYDVIVTGLLELGFEKIEAAISSYIWLWNGYSDDRYRYKDKIGGDFEPDYGVYLWKNDGDSELDKKIWDGFIKERPEEE